MQRVETDTTATPSDLAPEPKVTVFRDCTVCVGEAGAYRVVSAHEVTAVECGPDLVLRAIGRGGVVITQWTLTTGECDAVILNLSAAPASLALTRQGDLWRSQRTAFDLRLHALAAGNPSVLLRAWRRPALVEGAA